MHRAYPDGRRNFNGSAANANWILNTITSVPPDPFQAALLSNSSWPQVGNTLPTITLGHDDGKMSRPCIVK